tara:strand:+ start:16212 stop:17183 length:972 start_codon:yes stop_codon:yes gene_type:complete
MKINNITVVPRKNRPTPLGKTLLEFFYVKNGVYSDPYQVCSVVAIRDQSASSTRLGLISNGDPEAYLDYNASSTEYGLVVSSTTSAVDMRWVNFSGPGRVRQTLPSNESFNVTSYDGSVSAASGIYRIKEGHFGVILQPLAVSTSALTDIGGPLVSDYAATHSHASGVGKYYDFWTIVDFEGAQSKVYINTFDLWNDTILGLAEPLSVTSRNKLLQKYVNVNSVVSLSISTTIALNDTSVPKDVRSIFNNAVIQAAQIQIKKFDENNEEWETLQAFTDVDNITSNDTMKYGYTFSNVGRYQIQVKYSLMDETIYSDKFSLICR